MVSQADLLDTLLGHGVTGRKEDLPWMSIIELLQTRSLRTYGSGDTLSEHRALSQLGTVPGGALAI